MRLKNSAKCGPLNDERLRDFNPEVDTAIPILPTCDATATLAGIIVMVLNVETRLHAELAATNQTAAERLHTRAELS